MVKVEVLKYYVHPASGMLKHWVFAFYGYGQNREVFAPLLELISSKFGLIIFDLPYRESGEIFKKEDFKNQIEALILQHGIQKISGISYSIGSRYNLILAEYFAHKIDKLFLVAPDGIKINFWNKFATSTFIGNQLFKLLMYHPNAYLQILTIIYKFKLLPKTLYTFSKWHVRNYENSTMVYFTWMNMKYMIPDLKLIKENKMHHPFQMLAYFGINDRVIDKSCMNRLKKKVPTAVVKELNKGHNVLDDKLFHDIASLL